MLILLSLLTSLARLVCINASPTIQLGNTTLIGLGIPTFQQDLFAGIPFAEPPLGSLRLKPPMLKAGLNSDTFDATSFGPACLQTVLPLDQVSEDCLTVNVLRPTETLVGAKLPVMFWTYGGGFFEGFSVVYNASGIVAQSVIRGTPVIYVNFNYRLGPLGFPQGQEADSNGALNLGLKDQIAALEWVQLNIGAFGGDPDKVTLFGQSAGSIMTSILFLNSPLTKLARAAIFESGSQASTPLFAPQSQEINWQNFVGGVPSCASIATSGNTFSCLQNATTTEIFQGLSVVLPADSVVSPFNPVMDGPEGFIPDLPSVLFKRGQFSRLPFIAGTDLDEGTLFTPTTVNSTQEIEEGAIGLFSPSISPANLEQSVLNLLSLYPDIPALGWSPFNTGNNTFGLSPQYKRAAAIVGDLDFLSQRRLWIETAANAGVPTFGYLFTQPQPELPPLLGVEHSSEITYVYGALADNSSSSILLSRIMTDYWVSFATSLTPNDGLGVVPRPEWTQFTPQNKAVIQLNGTNITMIPDDFRAEQTGFINSDPAIWRH
ncbi:extracellular triacylglycerol lipase precursor [Mycena maculata]|uniref:Carboxylic ester hydrolase n=1 Tax=Mycena maculata TaxID=230809 RepID=A0AAD7NM80_9AGAR|nr:extracellular triacylglycerol lipase precursor [Mycena maculata]